MGKAKDDKEILGKRKEGEAECSTAAPTEEAQDVAMTEADSKVGKRLTGHYDLVSVLTHKGRSADSGHYIAFIKREKEGDWVSYDDDKPSSKKEEEVLFLSGGGPDHDMAYLCVYKARML